MMCTEEMRCIEEKTCIEEIKRKKFSARKKYLRKTDDGIKSSLTESLNVLNHDSKALILNISFILTAFNNSGSKRFTCMQVEHVLKAINRAEAKPTACMQMPLSRYKCTTFFAAYVCLHKTCHENAKCMFGFDMKQLEPIWTFSDRPAKSICGTFNSYWQYNQKRGC